MPLDDPDVTADPSPAPAPDPTPAPVQAPSPPVADDRPIQNVVAEMNRKHTLVMERLDQLAGALSRPAPVSAQPAGFDGYTDDQLKELYRAGSADALLELNRRQLAQRDAATQAAGYLQSQITSLVARYPAINDPASPLRQAIQETHRALIGQGAASGLASTLEAIRSTILENPDLAKPVPKPGPTPANFGDPTPRRPAAPRPSRADSTVTAKEARIARDMGVKDIAKAKANFQKKMDEGRTSLSPNVAIVIREQEG